MTALEKYQARRKEVGEKGFVKETHISPHAVKPYMKATFILRGDLGAVHFHCSFCANGHRGAFDNSHGIERHRPTNYIEGVFASCEVLLGLPCGPALGTSLSSTDAYAYFLNGDMNGVWDQLSFWYNLWFIDAVEDEDENL